MLRWKNVLYYARYSNPEPPRRLELTEAEWQARLTPEQYQVLRQHQTEPPYRNAYCRRYEPGLYSCAGCASVLFAAETKYHGMSGWPSFTHPVAKNALSYFYDDSYHMQRIEAQCNVCGGHLGHVFPDGPAPSGLRYCINSVSLCWSGPPCTTATAQQAGE